MRAPVLADHCAPAPRNGATTASRSATVADAASPRLSSGVSVSSVRAHVVLLNTSYDESVLTFRGLATSYRAARLFGGRMPPLEFTKYRSYPDTIRAFYPDIVEIDKIPDRENLCHNRPSRVE